MEKLNKILNEYKGIIISLSFFATLFGINQFNLWEFVNENHLHLFFISIICFFILHYFSAKNIKKCNDKIDKQSNRIMKQGVKMEIGKIIREYSGKKTITDFKAIEYIKGIEDERIKYGINSFHERGMKGVMSKIKWK